METSLYKYEEEISQSPVQNVLKEKRKNKDPFDEDIVDEPKSSKTTSKHYPKICVSIFIVSVCIVTAFVTYIRPKYHNVYCQLKCPSNSLNKTILCVAEPCRPAKNCQQNYVMLQNTKKMRDFIREQVNGFRNLVAGGNYLKQIKDEVADMRTISWSRELEFMAKCWANQCNLYADVPVCAVMRSGQNALVNFYQKKLYRPTEDLSEPEWIELGFKSWLRHVDEIGYPLVR